VLGERKSSHIDFLGDEDWFYIELTADMEYRFDLTGNDSSGGTVSDPLLSLYDEFGSLLIENNNGGTGLDSQFFYTPSSTGTYFLGSASPNADAETGTYTLIAREAFNITPFIFVFDDPEGLLAFYRSEIENNILAAWENWDVYIDAAPGAAIEILIVPLSDDSPSAWLASAGPRGTVFLGENVLRGTPAHELITGEDENGEDYDGSININVAWLQEEDQYDFIIDNYPSDDLTSFEAVMTHELGHILGFAGWFDDGIYVSPLQALVDQEAGVFRGKYAMAANGGPVVLTEADYSHLSSAYSNTIMTASSSRGATADISLVEIAMLADTGPPIQDQYLIA
jgi:hypothetical protein